MARATRYSIRTRLLRGTTHAPTRAPGGACLAPTRGGLRRATLQGSNLRRWTIRRCRHAPSLCRSTPGCDEGRDAHANTRSSNRVLCLRCTWVARCGWRPTDQLAAGAGGRTRGLSLPIDRPWAPWHRGACVGGGWHAPISSVKLIGPGLDVSCMCVGLLTSLASITAMCACSHICASNIDERQRGRSELGDTVWSICVCGLCGL